ncbi:MAG: NTP transferase domain-containing protein [Acidobacteria bacterium]|nr:NTP transferase domain-containing protein [Acidobacteriota bacterium]
MNGMVLAAGRGERMEPLSSLIPKPALDMLGRPLLASAFDHLRAAGCGRVVINLHRHPALVAAAARQAAAPARPRFSWEPRLLGGAGGVAGARPKLGAGPVLTANADVWAALDLAALLAAGAPEAAVLALLPHPDPARWSSVELAPDGRVGAFLPPGAASRGDRYLFTGFQLLGAQVVASLPAPPAEMAPVWDELRRHGRLCGAVVTGDWREAGDPAAYRALVVELLAGTGRAHPEAALGDGVRLDGSWVGARCTVGHGAELEATVVIAGAEVGAGCRLARCVVAAGARVEAGCTLADALVLPSGITRLSPQDTINARSR